MTRENIIEKIQKLTKHEESARKVGSVAEAELFAEKINELLIKHKLEMDDVHTETCEDDQVDQELFRFDDHGLQSTRKRSPWQELLAHYVAEYSFCKIMVVIGSNSIYFVGRREDRSIAVYLFSYLVKTIACEAQRKYDQVYNEHYKRGSTMMIADWKQSFYIGVIHSLRNRFEKIRVKEKHSEHGEQFALVLTKSQKELDDFVDEKTTGKVKGQQKNRVNSLGYKQGHEFGQSLSLNKAVETTQSAGQLPV